MKYKCMDGELHHTEDQYCCRPINSTCKDCGGFVHWQPVWGGFFEACENCSDGWGSEIPEGCTE